MDERQTIADDLLRGIAEIAAFTGFLNNRCSVCSKMEDSQPSR
jgi:hypothetical protein